MIPAGRTPAILATAVLTAQLVFGPAGASEDSPLTTPAFADDNPARVWVADNAVHFYGDISRKSARSFMKAVETAGPDAIDRIVINSWGGNTRSGRAIGRWVFEHHLDVEVDAVCFSSCANYIFPAGVQKTIRAGSIVGWHGSEAQFDILALSEPGKTGTDLQRAAIADSLRNSGQDEQNDAELQKDVEWHLVRAERSRADEIAFFEEIGTDPEFTIHGMRPGHLGAFRASLKDGWTYSLDDMKRLGLGQVTYLGEDDYAVSDRVHANLAVIAYQPSKAGQ